MTTLHRHSIDVLLGNQSASGAFVACPTMPDYHYSWFRDGSYIAYALDLVGQQAAARRFHQWAAEVIAAYAAVVRRAEALAAARLPLDEAAILHTRYTLDGRPGRDQWPNFQLDGFGTWLWAILEHARQCDMPLPTTWRHAIDLCARYLTALGQQPNYDLWEENSDRRHSYTQAAVYAGLLAAGTALQQPAWLAAALQVRRELFTKAVRAGHFTKFLDAGDAAVDASLLGLALPHAAVPLDHPFFTATIAQIERDLRPPGGGVHRFAWDVYYGGGEWILLAAWLGWYYALAGQFDRAAALRAWIEAQAGASGDLPEQVTTHLIEPAAYQPWVEQRGPIARPLLWSHAKYLVLCEAVGREA